MLSRKSLFSLLHILLMFGLCLFSTAQERRGAAGGKGMISGTVTDADHAVLPGARIELQPIGRKLASDGKGQFVIPDLTPGKYTLSVSCVGFQPFSAEIAVNAGQVTNTEAVLKVEARNEVVEVRGERQRGEVEALNRERTADNILQVLPSEVITSLPNTNIADAVGRLPSVSLERDEGEGKYVQIRGTEPRLSNVTVDGVHLPSPEGVRNVKLDAIPSDLVESVELSKTLSANQDGDAIGGSVNLVTKSATDKPYLSLLGMGGYNSLSGGRTVDQFSGTYGQRFGKEKRLGLMFGGTYDWNGRAIEDLEPSVTTTDTGNGDFATGVPVTNGTDLRQYRYDRTRYGFGGTADYRLGAGSSIYLRGMFSEFQDFGEDWIYSPSIGSFASQNLSNADGSSSFSHVTRKPEQRLFNVVTGGRHDLGRTLINYELSLGQARFTGIFPSANFAPTPGGPLDNSAGGVVYAVDTANPHTPRLVPQGGVNLFDPSSYVLDQISQGDSHTFERDVIGGISVSRQYSAGSHFGTLEFGTKVRDAKKSSLSTQQIFSADDTLSMSQVLGTFTNPGYYFGVYGPYGPTTDYNKILALFNSNPGAFTLNVKRTTGRNIPNDFDTSERVYAGYGMNTITFGRARLQAGVRVEATSASFLGFHVTNNDPNTVTPVSGDQTYTDVLPSVQFQYNLGHDTLLRAAYGMGIARPNFSDLPPRIVESDGSTPNKSTVSVGNPALKPEHAQNFDLQLQHYFKSVGVIEGGVFYKYLTDPIFAVQTTLASGPFAGFKQIQPVNGGSARLTGIEMAWQQQLKFLPGALNGTGVRANYSYTTSNVDFPVGFGRTDHPALQRQAPNNWNFDVTYDKKGVSARMGLTHNDANIFFYNFHDNAPAGIGGPNGDQYLFPHTQVDAQVSYWIPRAPGFQFIVSLLNLNNEVFGFYQGSERFPVQREYYSPTYSFGLRWTMGREH